jgi:hypothetical protein
MLDRADQHFVKILDLSDQLAAVAQSGYSAFDDDGSLLLNGIVRDCAFRLRDAVEVEMRARQAKVPCNVCSEGRMTGKHGGAMVPTAREAGHNKREGRT